MKESTEEKPTLVQSTSKTFMHSESDLASFEPPEVAPTTGAMENQGKGPRKVLSSSPSSAKLKFSISLVHTYLTIDLPTTFGHMNVVLVP